MNILEKHYLMGRMAMLKNALYRTRKDRNKYERLYHAEKRRANRYKERLREKRSELFELKNEKK